MIREGMETLPYKMSGLERYSVVGEGLCALPPKVRIPTVKIKTIVNSEWKAIRSRMVTDNKKQIPQYQKGFCGI